MFRSPFKNLCCQLAMSLLFGAELSAQKLAYRIEAVSLEQGVSHNFIQCLLQDRQGFLWLGTLLGLVRYDGYTYITYRHDAGNPHSLSHDDISTLHQDDDGNLWIGTFGGGLNKFDPARGNFTRYLHKPADSASIAHGFVLSLCADPTSPDILWVGTQDGLCKFDKRTQTFTRYRHDPANPASLSHNTVRALHADKSGTLWVGTTGGGLCRFDRENNHFVRYRHDPANPKSLSHDRVRAIFQESNGAFWIGTGHGLNRFDPERGEFVSYHRDPANPNSLSGDGVNNIFEDRNGNLWIGTDRGLNLLQRERNGFVRFFDDSATPSGQGANAVTAICQDRAGILWIGMYYVGLKKLFAAPPKFTHFFSGEKRPASLSHNYVFAIYEDRAERVWIGSAGGLDLFDEAAKQFKHYLPNFEAQNFMRGRIVTAIGEDGSGTLWIGTTGGLQKFDERRNRFETFRYIKNDTNSLSHDYVTALCADHSGNLWVGTRYGLNYFDLRTGRFTRFKHNPAGPNSLCDNYIASLYEDRSGTLWIGTYGGLSSLSWDDRHRGRFINFKHDLNDSTSLSHNFCFAIHEDACHGGTFWIATGSGLNLFNRVTGTFRHYTEKDGLPSSVICGILEDANGALWLSTQKGLSRFDPQTETFANFDLSDGLQSNMFHIGASGKRKNGAMLFGGINGVNYFHPRSLTSNPHVPPVVITAFKKFDKGQEVTRDISAAEAITLSYKENFFSFEFAALDFSQPEKNQYAYKLEGLEADWVEAGTRRYAHYTNLAPGEYVFRVKASNNDGLWNEQGAAFGIKINPPFWKTAWFAAICAGMLLTIVAAVHHLRVRAKIKQLLALERARRMESERVRKKAANDFHDELGHRLTKIALFSEIIKSGENGGNGEFAAYLDKIIDDCQRLTNDTRDFIWTLDPNKDSLHELILYLKDFADKLFDRTGVAFRVAGLAPELEKVKLSADAKRHLTLIFKEGMNNILKHAECRNATLQVEAGAGQIRIMLRDDGKGCNGNMNGSGYGLKNMRERAEKIHGLFNVHSRPGEGTEIELLAQLSDNNPDFAS
jgi:ligand-binding sensor domain-containing protein/signal transduction histidine kinase